MFPESKWEVSAQMTNYFWAFLISDWKWHQVSFPLGALSTKPTREQRAFQCAFVSATEKVKKIEAVTVCDLSLKMSHSKRAFHRTVVFLEKKTQRCAY